MIRKLVVLALILLVGLGAFVIFAPMAPDGSWLHDFGDSFRDAMGAWWGNPIAP